MADPPSDATVLFNGKDFSKWHGEKDPKKNPDGEVKWKIEDGYMETTSTGVIWTKDQFGSFQMHLEWATPKDIHGKDGKVLHENLSEEQLKAQAPEIHELIKTSVAGTSGKDGAFMDGRISK